jgi:hypothetical protein
VGFHDPENPAPDPNSFLRTKIVMETSKISVFVNDNEEPCLVVEPLSERRRGRIGLRMGNS